MTDHAHIAADRAILAVLAPGGLLTAAQICRDAELGDRQVRAAMQRLAARGHIMAGPRGARWAITPRGMAAVVGGDL